MPLGMKHNIVSINALNHLAAAQNELYGSLRRLSSGQRINSGADDPAGLVISEGLRAQIASVQQALQNTEFSLSLVQTAEGALAEVNNLLIEMRQLACSEKTEQLIHIINKNVYVLIKKFERLSSFILTF